MSSYEAGRIAFKKKKRLNQRGRNQLAIHKSGLRGVARDQRAPITIEKMDGNEKRRIMALCRGGVVRKALKGDKNLTNSRREGKRET